jgi:hypothetical protein
MYEDEVRKVQCVVCGEVHSYRKPRGDAAEEAADAVPKRPVSRRTSWEDALGRSSEVDLAKCRPFSVRDTYEVGDVVYHPKFDVGFVSELLSDNKVEIIFRDEPKILIHNRIDGDWAKRMPEISEMPAPREAKKKRPKKNETPPQPIVLRNKADIDAAIGRARTAAQTRTDEVTRASEIGKKGKGKGKPEKAAAKAADKGKGKSPDKGKPAKAVKPAKPAKAAKAAKKPAAKAKKGAKKPPAKKSPPKKAAPKKSKPKPAAKKPAKKKKR